MKRGLGSRRAARFGVVGAVLACACALGFGASPVHAGRGAVIVPPSVVHTSWRSPEMMTKDAQPRHDVLRDRAFEALEAYENAVASKDPRVADRYQRALASVVSIVAARTFVSRSEMLAAWQSTSSRHQKAILVGLTTLGAGYLFGSDNPKKGLDCSGLVAYAWAKAGVSLPMKSDRQIDQSREVSRAEARAGVIVGYPGHTMIYLGVGDIVLHSARPNLGVRVGPINWRESPNVRFADPAPES
ncbi:MAG: C40 family peptidase [Acidobacteria bacterium]|nr:C40 family peptidase [Acidobacteriota bacterium]